MLLLLPVVVLLLLYGMAVKASCLKKGECLHQSNKDFNLQAVIFRTYEEALFKALLHNPSHVQFLASVGLTEFINLTWTHVHQELAIEFLKNYRKKKQKKSSGTTLTSSVRNKKIILTKRLIASTFKLSSTGYKHKDVLLQGKEVLSSLFDPTSAKRKGYQIRDCKDPAYFERLEALNRLMSFQPPGHLVSATLVDMVIHAAIQPVDWASFLLVSLMRELDRVTCSLHETPCTHVGVHIFLLLTHQKLVTSEHRLVLVRAPFALLDGYTTIPIAPLSSPGSSPPGSPRKTVRFHNVPRKGLVSRARSHLAHGHKMAVKIRRCIKRVHHYIWCGSGSGSGSGSKKLTQ